MLTQFTVVPVVISKCCGDSWPRTMFTVAVFSAEGAGGCSDAAQPTGTTARTAKMVRTRKTDRRAARTTPAERGTRGGRIRRDMGPPRQAAVDGGRSGSGPPTLDGPDPWVPGRAP